MIRLEKVVKCYGMRCVLQGVDLAVGRGDFIALMGSSGSGKSTLLNLIGGMDIPDGGRIVVDGEEISALPDKQLTLYRRKKIGFIFQFFNLLPNITVYDNIEIPLLLNAAEGDHEKIFALLKLVGLEGREKDQPYQLSGGEQQRVAIARAMVHDPEIILADEPTGNLDSATGQAIMETIRSIVKQKEKTVLLVTHDEAIARFADRTIKIRDGILHQ
ncbi:MAG TPA: ABC transporter ATP-binding protein [Dissulfurispiraceae bacterium]